MNPAEVVALVKELRAAGVTRYDTPDLKLEMLPEAAKDIPIKASEADVCKCKHPLHAHNNGVCLLGCEPQDCLGDEK